MTGPLEQARGAMPGLETGRQNDISYGAARCLFNELEESAGFQDTLSNTEHTFREFTCELKKRDISLFCVIPGEMGGKLEGTQDPQRPLILSD